MSKKLLSETPVLSYYNPNRETTLPVDASKYGLGGILLQKHESKLLPVAYCSRSLSISEKELGTKQELTSANCIYIWKSLFISMWISIQRWDRSQAPSAFDQ